MFYREDKLYEIEPKTNFMLAGIKIVFIICVAKTIMFVNQNVQNNRKNTLIKNQIIYEKLENEQIKKQIMLRRTKPKFDI